MRIAAMLLASALISGSAVAEPRSAPPLSKSPECKKTTSYLAEQTGSYRGQRIQPKKLTELPPPTAYMAVHRKIDGCEAPLTMVDYRSPRR
ncbi:MAG TPA: hypothetical protein VIL42_04760 [Sphingomicrobium sp.]|jgi:hypothetical protein